MTTTATMRVRWAVVAVFSSAAVLASSLVVWNASNAAFSSNTENSGNLWDSSHVFITDDDSGATNGTERLFNLSNLKGGETGSRCITVTYTGELDADVRLYLSATAGDLDDYITMVVTRQPKTNVTADCTNYVDAGATSAYASALINAFPTSYVGAAGNNWHPDETADPDEAWTYKFTYTLSNAAAAQDKNCTVTFRWETLAT